MREPVIRVRSARRSRRLPVGVFGVFGVAIVLLAAGAGSLARPHRATPARPVEADAAPASDAAMRSDPTPLFARHGDLYLRLPVSPDAITQVAFHQASGDDAVHLDSLVPEVSATDASKARSVIKPPVPAAPDAEEAATIWDGSVIRLWRSNRRGTPDTAIDVGADPGMPVVSPVSGVVIEIRPYQLYGRYDDFEIHIRPDGFDDLDLVLIHVDDVSVRAGSRVEAGLTTIARVRKMSHKTDLQLAGYTRNGGDHVHIQLNRLEPSGSLPALDGGS